MNTFIISVAEHCRGCGVCKMACVEVHAPVGSQAYPRLHETKTPQGIMHIQYRHCKPRS